MYILVNWETKEIFMSVDKKRTMGNKSIHVTHDIPFQLLYIIIRIKNIYLSRALESSKFNLFDIKI